MVFVTAEIGEAVARAREGVDLTAHSLVRCKTTSKNRTRAAKQSEPVRLTVAPGSCVTGSSSIDISSSLPSRAKTYVSATNMTSVRVTRSNKRLAARARARARV